MNKILKIFVFISVAQCQLFIDKKDFAEKCRSTEGARGCAPLMKCARANIRDNKFLEAVLQGRGEICLDAENCDTTSSKNDAMLKFYNEQRDRCRKLVYFAPWKTLRTR